MIQIDYNQSPKEKINQSVDNAYGLQIGVPRINRGELDLEMLRKKSEERLKLVGKSDMRVALREDVYRQQ